MRYKDEFVIYDKFNTIVKQKPCSLVEYKTVYGAIKFAIILNSARTIIFNKHTKLQGFNRTAEVNRSENMRNLKILGDYCEKMRRIAKDQSVTFNTFNIVTEYRLNNSEYIINFPVSMLHMSGNNRIEINKLPANLERIISIIKGTRLGDRLRVFDHKIITINNEDIIFYKMNDIYNKIDELTLNIEINCKGINHMIVENQNFNTTKAQVKGYKKSVIIKNNVSKTEIEKELKRTIINYNNTKDNSLEISKQIEDKLSNTHLTQSKTERTTIENKDNDVLIFNKELQTPDSIVNKGNLEPEKKLRSFIATNRNLTIVKYLKNLYQDKCQVCGETIEVSPGSFLSEVHHIKPLGIHNGPDIVENAIVLCPNHHTMFDRGAITIDIDKKIVIHFNPDNPLNNKHIELKHEIKSGYIAFHNMNIFINPAEHQNQEDMFIVKDEIAATIQTVNFGNIVTLQDMDTSELFDIKLEDKFNKDFMKPLEKVILRKCLHDIVRYDAFRYKVISICAE
jgi:predicted restriction endonuclease